MTDACLTDIKGLDMSASIGLMLVFSRPQSGICGSFHVYGVSPPLQPCIACRLVQQQLLPTLNGSGDLTSQRLSHWWLVACICGWILSICRWSHACVAGYICMWSTRPNIGPTSCVWCGGRVHLSSVSTPRVIVGSSCAQHCSTVAEVGDPVAILQHHHISVSWCLMVSHQGADGVDAMA
jgi:hypothetical protein